MDGSASEHNSRDITAITSLISGYDSTEVGVTTPTSPAAASWTAKHPPDSITAGLSAGGQSGGASLRHRTPPPLQSLRSPHSGSAALPADGRSTPPLLSDWACDHHGTGRHSVFGSYRVASEGPLGNGLIEKLVDAIESGAGEKVDAPPSAAVTVFYDVRCLNTGESWELGLKNGLEGASLVMPLVSATALQGMIEHAATRRDNLLMEWEIALERQRNGQCLVLPIFVQLCDANFRESSYPDTPHFLSKISIRSTLSALFKIHGVKLSLDRSGAPDSAQLTEAVGKVRRLLDSQEARAMQHQAQREYMEERERKDLIWKRVAAIIDKDDVIGRGASSVVYRGHLYPTETEELPVAVKVIKQDVVAAGKQFSTELEIMKGLEVRASI